MDKQIVDKQIYAVGDRVEKLCAVCGEERGHLIASVTKRGHISRVDCPKCSTRSSFKTGVKLRGGRTLTQGGPYDRTRKYSKGQTMLHPSFGAGEVMAIVEPQKIDVLFADRMRRLIHERAQAQA
jgi:hypothetical protein